jgi:rRNA small subunit pseudouridine methyltransferase Nep1
MCSKVTLILLDSAVERIPDKILNHPSVIKDAKKRGRNPEKILLDDSIHHSAIKLLQDSKNRGRPDIIHFCLITVLDSPVSERIKIYIHTVNDEIVRINNRARLPRNYNRFKGLIEDLFEKKVIKNDDVLLEIVESDLNELLSSTGCDVILMSEAGEKNIDFLKETIKKGAVVCIGGFPHGEFRKKTLKILKKHGFVSVSLGKSSYTSNYVVGRILCLMEG